MPLIGRLFEPADGRGGLALGTVAVEQPEIELRGGGAALGGGLQPALRHVEGTLHHNAFGIKRAQQVLSGSVTRFGGFFQPFERLVGIFPGADAAQPHQAEVVLRLRAAAFGCSRVPAESLAFVLVHARTGGVHGGHVALRQFAALPGGGEVPAERLLQIDRITVVAALHDAGQTDLRVGVAAFGGAPVMDDGAADVALSQLSLLVQQSQRILGGDVAGFRRPVDHRRGGADLAVLFGRVETEQAHGTHRRGMPLFGGGVVPLDGADQIGRVPAIVGVALRQRELGVGGAALGGFLVIFQSLLHFFPVGVGFELLSHDELRARIAAFGGFAVKAQGFAAVGGDDLALHVKRCQGGHRFRFAHFGRSFQLGQTGLFVLLGAEAVDLHASQIVQGFAVAAFGAERVKTVSVRIRLRDAVPLFGQAPQLVASGGIAGIGGHLVIARCGRRILFHGLAFFAHASQQDVGAPRAVFARLQQQFGSFGAFAFVQSEASQLVHGGGVIRLGRQPVQSFGFIHAAAFFFHVGGHVIGGRIALGRGFFQQFQTGGRFRGGSAFAQRRAVNGHGPELFAFGAFFHVFERVSALPFLKKHLIIFLTGHGNVLLDGGLEHFHGLAGMGLALRMRVHEFVEGVHGVRFAGGGGHTVPAHADREIFGDAAAHRVHIAESRHGLGRSLFGVGLKNAVGQLVILGAPRLDAFVESRRFAGFGRLIAEGRRSFIPARGRGRAPRGRAPQKHGQNQERPPFHCIFRHSESLVSLSLFVRSHFAAAAGPRLFSRRRRYSGFILSH